MKFGAKSFYVQSIKFLENIIRASQVEFQSFLIVPQRPKLQFHRSKLSYPYILSKIIYVSSFLFISKSVTVIILFIPCGGGLWYDMTTIIIFVRDVCIAIPIIIQCNQYVLLRIYLKKKQQLVSASELSYRATKSAQYQT